MQSKLKPTVISISISIFIHCFRFTNLFTSSSTNTCNNNSSSNLNGLAEVSRHTPSPPNQIDPFQSAKTKSVDDVPQV